MKKVCAKYGVLLILDEVMCGMGRTGYLHAWQEENVVPDIQILGKGLAGGYQAISAVLINHTIANAFLNGPGRGMFSHGHTFQNFPRACVAGLAVQKIVRDDNLLENVKVKGKILQQRLNKQLMNHPHVGDIRGKGLFQGVGCSNSCHLSWLTMYRLSLCRTKRPRSHSRPIVTLRGDSM
jgi:adenosylmethionine-8-amino-7-oxononanoate aminotransferase